MFREILILLLAGFGGIIVWNAPILIGVPIGTELFILATQLQSLIHDL